MPGFFDKLGKQPRATMATKCSSYITRHSCLLPHGIQGSPVDRADFARTPREICALPGLVSRSNLVGERLYRRNSPRARLAAT
jgi:hypothetical protein